MYNASISNKAKRGFGFTTVWEVIQEVTSVTQMYFLYLFFRTARKEYLRNSPYLWVRHDGLATIDLSFKNS